MHKFLSFATVTLAWVFTVQGQFQYQFQHFTQANTLAFTTNNFHCIGVGEKNELFAGSQYGGLYKYDDSIKVWIKSVHLTNVFINDIKRDANGGIWIAQSGTQGTTGGASSIAGGINYFPERFDQGMVFYSVPGTTTGGGLPSRNVRALWVDTVSTPNPKAGLPRLWASMNTYITSGSTSAGGIAFGVNPTANFFNTKRKGLQVFPFALPSGTPQCDAIGGDDKEVWISARTNFGNSQIIRYHPSGSENSFLGTYTHLNTPDGLFSGFRANAIHFDPEGRRWIGFNGGGFAVEHLGNWKRITDPLIFPAGAIVNNNAITHDEYGYVYIGTSHGLLIFNGGSAVDNPVGWTHLTTEDGLLSNNVTGVAYDYKNGRVLLTTNAGISFMTPSYKIDVSMQWDNSFPGKRGNPFGVAADGVSRIYLKIKAPKDSSQPVEKVEVSIADYSASESTLRGSLKNANYLTLQLYDEDANTGTTRSVSRTDGHPTAGDGSFWFWYKSPEDFSGDSTGTFALQTQRYDSVKIVLTYTNQVKDSIIYKIRIVRPPLLMVHGLASGPSTWANLRHTNGSTLFINSPLWLHKRALVMSGRNLFVQNARLLLGGDAGLDTARDNMNTLQGNIAYLRSMGYACNQVDYLCHSMGGIMIRMAMGIFPEKFFAGAGSPYEYKTYSKGFTHKIITVNTPHNSSPVADLVDEFMPAAPPYLRDLFRLWYRATPNAQQPFDFIEPKVSAGFNPFSPSDWSTIDSFVASPAVKNLQINDFRRGQRAGINLKENHARHHMIYGNGHPAQISEANATTLRELKSTFDLLNNMMDCILSLPLPPNVENTVKGFRALGTVVGALAFWEWYCAQLGYPDYLANSDLIVPLASQVARIPQPDAKPYITRFEGSSAMHTTILGRDDVGSRILSLLNSKVSSALFNDVLPANTDPDPVSITQNRMELQAILQQSLKAYNPLSTGTFYNKSRIEILQPSAAATLDAGTQLQVQIQLKNGSQHIYTRIHCMGIDSFNTINTVGNRNYTFAVDPSLPGRQTITAIAAYRNAQQGVDYYVDTLSVQVTHPAPLQGFRVVQRQLSIKGGELYSPTYEARYNNQWIPIAPQEDMQVSVENEHVLAYYPAGLRFAGLRDGFTPVLFSYQGFRDTVLAEVTMPQASFCTNHTIASGNLSNPAIWSRGRVPAPCDVLTIQHAVVADSSMPANGIIIAPGASLTIAAGITLTLGQPEDDGSTQLHNKGTLTIQNGHLEVRGHASAFAGSSFSMPKGTLTIRGNPELGLE